MSLGLATSLSLGVYDSQVTSVSEEEALRKTKQLISSLAKSHRSNSQGGWGNHWQSAHWSYFSGLGGWLLWENFSLKDQEYIRKMVEYEANRFITYRAPYWKGENGVVIYEGDSKSEENAWNSQILQLATSMMPNHPNYNKWMYKNIELMVSAGASKQDLTNSTILHGKSISQWVKGININQDGTVINHGFIHPDYMEFIAFNNTAGITSTLSGTHTPKAAFFNSDLVYGAYSTVHFESPPYHSPGGTIYRPGKSDIYYPLGNDWGTDRRMQFATLDSFAHSFGYDHNLSIKGDEWEKHHNEMVLSMQERHTDGRTYSAHSEDKYTGREEWVAHHVAWSLLSKWVLASGEFTIGNEKLKTITNRIAGSNRYSTAVEISKQGWTSADSVVVGLGTNYPDVLSATPFAYQENAPILLTEPEELPDVVLNEIIRLKAKKVYVIGGTSAISNNVEKQISGLGVKVERIGGSSRYETSTLLASKLKGTGDKVFLASGENFPDALSIATIAARKGYPILLTKKESIPYHTNQFLAKAKEVYIIGGEQVIAPTVKKSLSQSIRIDGEDRYSTSAKIVEHFSESLDSTIFLSSGRTFPDALAGSVLAAKEEGVLLLSEKSTIPYSTKKVLEQSTPVDVNYLGGREVIGDIYK